MSFYHKYRLFFNLVGLVLLLALVLLFKVDLGATAALILRANLFDVALAVIFFVPFLAVKAWRWQIILRDLNLYISFRAALKLYALGLGAGMVTPGQIGDVVKVAYFRERGLRRALVSVLLDRLWDVLILLVLAGTGAVLFWQQFQDEWLALALLTLGTVALLAIIINPCAQAWLWSLLLRLRRTGLEQTAFEPLRLSAWQMLLQFAITVLATSVVYFRLYLLTAALDVQLDALPFVAAMSLATVAALLPLSVSGLGARDAALLLIAPLIGITREQALGISTLILFLSIINGLVGFGVWSATKSENIDLKSQRWNIL